MNHYALLILINVAIVSGLKAEVRNAYDVELPSAWEGLKNLNALLAGPRWVSSIERKRIHRRWEQHKEFIVYHKITQQLLAEFRHIDPDTYYMIDHLEDAKGRSVDVFVRFVPDDGSTGRIAATTNIPTQVHDDIYTSRYGPNTISVTIRLVKEALALLAHEFGHVMYQVPNIASYLTLHTRLYSDKVIHYDKIGHHHTDPSGRTASNVERQFTIKYGIYRKTNKGLHHNPVILLSKIEDEWSKERKTEILSWRLSRVSTDNNMQR